ncbi:MAG: aspartate aminotransferase family protein [Anaerolineaceae bacterium]|nr:aspartate aminotransferase family protein [Anaerolineaceae bacterium]
MAFADQHHRAAPLELQADDFRTLGYQMVDAIADFLASLPQRPVAPGKTPSEIRNLLHSQDPLPEDGADAERLLGETAKLLFENSTFNGHPRFLGYITSSAAPIGALGDLLAASVNPNVGAGGLSPMATEIEAQTVRWIAELLGYPVDGGGLMVSGGNMANFTGFLAARKARASWDVRKAGMRDSRLRVYASNETHTWIQKAADLFGLGTDAIRWLPTDAGQRMDTAALRQAIAQDRANGDEPFMVVGTAGSVSTGAVDPLPEIAAICRESNLWFHVDGAYGAPAAALPDAPDDLKGLREADSLAVDPHKWLYAPLEAGCILVRDASKLLDAFSYHPIYYHFDSEQESFINYYEYGLQNSRGFRALKVWLALRQVGRNGYVQMMTEDIRLMQALYRLADEHPELEAATHNLSITTLRYVPAGLQPGTEAVGEYLNNLNEALLTNLQNGGEVFLSNAVVGGRFLLRACVVNFRTSSADIHALPEIIVRAGRALDDQMRPDALR